MGSLGRAMEWLRPLVDSKNWEYCVVWKLGDDPSRFIEWVGCCCCGAKGKVNVSVKKENGEKQKTTPLCRDSQVQHPIRTKACEALARFPRAISLYSGIQGEVVTSNEPKWINHTDASNSGFSPYPWQESKGTLVLIPVIGGLVELYNSKLIYKDQKTIDYIIARFKLSSEEANCPKGYLFTAKKEDGALDSIPFKHLSFSNTPLQYTSFPSSAPLISESSTNPSIQGSSTGSTPLCHSPSDHLSLNQHIDGHFEHTGFQWDQENYKPAGDIVTVGKRRQGGPYQSKNLVTERRRRNRIKDGLFALRALVPNISKMDKVAILGDAIDYIKELEENVKEYHSELNEIAEEEVSNKDSAEMVLPEANGKAEIEVQVEVNQTGAREFLVKVSRSHKPGGFTQLMDAINCLGLEVVNVSSTTSGKGVMLSIFIAKANREGVLDAQKLRSSLVELTS